MTSADKTIPVCTFVEKQNWWGAKHVKKGIKSTVLAVDWCVNNKFIVSGASDFKCRVHSAYISSIDPEEDDGFGQLWPNQHDFGALLCEFDHAQGWVNNVAWSPDGFKIAFAGHGATISFKNLQGIIPRIPHIPHQNNYTFSFIPLIHTQFKLSSTTNF